MLRLRSHSKVHLLGSSVNCFKSSPTTFYISATTAKSTAEPAAKSTAKSTAKSSAESAESFSPACPVANL